MSQITSLSLEEELKSNQELKELDIKCLREWCEKQPHLPQITDSTLAVFLHSNYYHVEITKANIDNYYTLRTQMPNIFSNRDAKDLRHIFYVLCALPLEGLTKDGYQIVLTKLLVHDPEKFFFHEFAKTLFMAIDLWVYQKRTGNGHIAVLDVEGISLWHAARINLLNLKKFFNYLQNALPVRLKRLHILNMTRGMEAIMKMAKPFMTKYLLNILHVHTTTEDFEKFVAIEFLPNELGGKAGQLIELHKAHIKKLEEHRDWFLEEELRSKIDETKRLSKAKYVQN